MKPFSVKTYFPASEEPADVLHWLEMGLEQTLRRRKLRRVSAIDAGIQERIELAMPCHGFYGTDFVASLYCDVEAA